MEKHKWTECFHSLRECFVFSRIKRHILPQKPKIHTWKPDDLFCSGQLNQVKSMIPYIQTFTFLLLPIEHMSPLNKFIYLLCLFIYIPLNWIWKQKKYWWFLFAFLKNKTAYNFNLKYVLHESLAALFTVLSLIPNFILYKLVQLLLY